MIDLHLFAATVLSAKKPEADLPIILLVKGLVVSGTICSFGEYLEKAPLAGKLEAFGNKLAPPGPEDLPRGTGTAEDPLVLPIPDYIHLRDAHVQLPGSVALPAKEGTYARIALAMIDGFMWGAIEHTA